MTKIQRTGPLVGDTDSVRAEAGPERVATELGRALQGQIAKVLRCPGGATVGLNVDELPQAHRLFERGWSP